MSSAVTPEEVHQIAALARLTLSDKEVATATRDLSNVLEHFSNLQALDTAAVPESANITGRVNITREDEARPAQLATPADLLDRAPATHAGYLKVPAVF